MGPHGVGDDVAEGVGFMLQDAVFPVGDGVVPGGDGVQDDLVADAKLLAEADPGVEIAVIIGHDAADLLPADHGGVVDIIGTVGLAGPGLLQDGGGDGVAADGLVQLHDGPQDVEMLLGEGFHAVVFGAGVGILPQLHVEGIAVGGNVGQDRILDGQAVAEGKALVDAVGGDGQGAFIGAGGGIGRDSDLHPDTLQGVVGHVRGFGGPEDVHALGAVIAVVGRDGPGGAAVAQVAAVVGLRRAQEGGGDIGRSDDVLAADEVAGGDGDVLQCRIHADQSQLAQGLVIFPGGQAFGENALALGLLIAVLGPLGIDVHDAAAQTGNGGDDLDTDLCRQTGGLGGQGDLGGAGSHGGNKARGADGGDGLIIGGVDPVGQLGVAGADGVPQLPGAALGEGDRRLFHRDAFCHIGRMVDDDLGAVDQRSAACACPAGGHGLEGMRALGQAVEGGDLPGILVAGQVEVVLTLAHAVDEVLHIAHRPVAAGIDVDLVAHEIHGVPDGAGITAGIVGPDMGAALAHRGPARLGEGEAVAVALRLGVGNGGGNGFGCFGCADARRGGAQRHHKGHRHAQKACECTVFHRIPPSFFDPYPQRFRLALKMQIYVHYNNPPTVVNHFFVGLHKNDCTIVKRAQHRSHPRAVGLQSAPCRSPKAPLRLCVGVSEAQLRE